MNFSLMNGYQFEDFITEILKKKGFDVEQTKYSGDGGIDIVAYSRDLLYSGKYIVQCKNFTGAVGQPEIRDLYGVVTSERANKGIIITPSDFTEQAYDFAKDKNIELINGTALERIIDTLHIEDKKATTNSFLDADGFNKERFLYLKSQISENSKETKCYVEFYEFMLKYIVNDSIVICDKKFFDEFEIVLLKWKKSIRNNKSNKNWIYIINHLLINIYIISGQLDKAVEYTLLGNSNELYFGKIPRFSLTHNYIGYYRESYSSSYTLYDPVAMNLYSSFCAIGYQKGVNIITSKIKPNISENDYAVSPMIKSIPYMYEFRFIDSNPQALYKEYLQFVNGVYDDTFSLYHLESTGYLSKELGPYTLRILDTNDIKSMKYLKKQCFRTNDEELHKRIDLVFKNHDIL